MKQIALSLLLAGTFLATVAKAQSSSTPVIGYYKITVPAGSSAWCSAFVTKKEFQGAATSSAPSGANTIITQTGASFGALTSHYVEILSGDNTGLILDVVSNAATTITIEGAVAIPAGTTYCVRKHATVSQVFRNGADLADFSDTVTIVDANGVEKAYGDDGSQIVDASDFATPAGNDIIYPGQGFVITSGGGEFTFGGNEVSYVKAGPTIIPAYAGRLNLVGVMSPVVDGSPGDAAATNEVTALSGLGFGTLADFSDTMSIFSVDGVLTEIVIGRDGSNFVNASDFTTVIPGTTPIRNGAAVSVTVTNDTTFTQPQLVP